MFKVKDIRTAPVVLVSLLLTLNIFYICSSVSIVNFEHVIVGRDTVIFHMNSVLLFWKCLKFFMNQSFHLQDNYKRLHHRSFIL